MTNTVRDLFNSRWSFGDVPRVKPIRAALDRALDAHDTVRERHASLAKNQHLSQIGRLDDMRGFISKTTAPSIRYARETAQTTRRSVAAWRERLLPKAPDPKDFAKAVLLSEMRALVKGLSKSASAKLLLENPDPDLVLAVLTAPGFLSGVSDDIRERARENYVSQHHPNDLAQIAQVEEAVELLEAATSMAFNAARTVSGFPSEQLFSDFLDQSAPPAPPTDSSDANADLLKQLPRVEPQSDLQKKSDETYARLLAEARAELAAL